MIEGLRIVDWQGFAEFVRTGDECKRKAQAARRKMLRELRKGGEPRQMKLFAGLGCLPGQQDLFQTDGEPEQVDAAGDTPEKEP